ncbi:hypothetical protein CMI45_01170 [Candidatus Pacearchaeota archaeon]|nr:hypothetical protein [Candidatus Pacearchaeota archaeon]|tara:strand:- start:7107 stop:7562 length:456 start_codon:yes stop_codon:yes gene_type:complete
MDTNSQANFNVPQTKQKIPNQINNNNSNTLALLNSLSNTQKAISTMSQLSNSLSIITEKYIDSLAKANESSEAINSINDIIDENYADDIELKTLIEKVLNKNKSSYHHRYIQNLHELGTLAGTISNGIKSYDGDANVYYRFQDKLNDLGLL